MKPKNKSIIFSSYLLKDLAQKYCSEKNIAINTLDITNTIEITGIIPVKFIKFPFKCKLEILPMESKILNIKLISFSALNISVPEKIQNLALKSLIKVTDSHCSYSNITGFGINLQEKLVKYGLCEITVTNIGLCDNSIVVDITGNSAINLLSKIKTLSFS